MTDNTNPGNFANRSKEEVSNIASKGGKTGTENSGFASMAKDKVVSSRDQLFLIYVLIRVTVGHCKPGREGFKWVF